MGGHEWRRAGILATVALIAVLGGCGEGGEVDREPPPGQSGITSVPSPAPPPRASPTSSLSGTHLALDQFITLLRQGRIQTATVLRGGDRLAGAYDRGEYWVELSEPDEVVARLMSAVEDAGVALAVEPARPYQGPGASLRIDQFITLLRQGRIVMATVVRAEERIVGSFDRGDYWVAYTGPLLARLTEAMRDAGLRVTER